MINPFFIYKELKSKLSHLTSVYDYTGTYPEEVTSAICIEISPEVLQVQYLRGNKEIAIKVPVHFHLVSQVLKDVNDIIDEEATLTAHHNLLAAMDTALKDLILRDGSIRYSSCFTKTGIKKYQYKEDKVYSILTYTVDLLG